MLVMTMNMTMPMTMRLLLLMMMISLPSAAWSYLHAITTTHGRHGTQGPRASSVRTSPGRWPLRARPGTPWRAVYIHSSTIARASRAHKF